MKKKLILISLAIALVAILAVGGSLAYFMDTDEVTNVFTIGRVDIEQNEVFVQESQLLPVVGTDPTDAEDNYIQKKVTVENVGKNGAYVQTLVAVPACLDNAGVLKLWDNNAVANGWTKLDGDASTAEIQPMYTVTIDNMLYNVYVYRYNTVLVKDAETAACLEYVYITPETDLNVYEDANGVKTAYFEINGTEITEFDATGKLNVYVATQGVQDRGFANANAALDTAFATTPWN